MTRDRSPCDGCRRVLDAALLDAVMVPVGNPIGEAIVCSEDDVWRPIGAFTWRLRIAAAFWRWNWR